MLAFFFYIIREKPAKDDVVSEMLEEWVELPVIGWKDWETEREREKERERSVWSVTLFLHVIPGMAEQWDHHHHMGAGHIQHTPLLFPQ